MRSNISSSFFRSSNHLPLICFCQCVTKRKLNPKRGREKAQWKKVWSQNSLDDLRLTAWLTSSDSGKCRRPFVRNNELNCNDLSRSRQLRSGITEKSGPDCEPGAQKFRLTTSNQKSSWGHVTWVLFTPEIGNGQLNKLKGKPLWQCPDLAWQDRGRFLNA